MPCSHLTDDSVRRVNGPLLTIDPVDETAVTEPFKVMVDAGLGEMDSVADLSVVASPGKDGEEDPSGPRPAQVERVNAKALSQSPGRGRAPP